MTVSTQTYLIQYSGDGLTTAFATSFEFINDSDLVVILTDSSGVDTTQTITTNYTVAGAGNDAGGTVTMLVAPASGERLTIYRSTALTQATDYNEFDAFPAESHEQALDKLTLIVQEAKLSQDRLLQFKESEDRSGGTKNSDVPSPEDGKVLGWNANGNLTNVSLGSVTYDIAITGGDAAKVVVVNATEDGIEVGDLPVASAATADTIAKRTATGQVKVAATPSAGADAASKSYVDSEITSAVGDVLAPVLVSTTNVTAVTSIDLATIFSANSSYKFFLIELRGVLPQTGSPTLNMRVSTDGSTFVSTANYDWVNHYLTDTSATATINRGSGDTELDISVAHNTTANSSGRYLITTDLNSGGSLFEWKRLFRETGGGASVDRAHGFGQLDTGTATGIQLLWSGGQNFDAFGSIRVYAANHPFIGL